jgi:hypothetical protein
MLRAMVAHRSHISIVDDDPAMRQAVGGFAVRHRRVLRHLLARLRRLRQRGPRGDVPHSRRLARQPRHRLRRRLARLRPHRADHGLRHRPHLRLPPQSGGHRRPGRRRPPSEVRSWLPYIIAQVLGGIAGAGVLYLIASGKAGFSRRRLRLQRLRRALARKYSMVAALVAEIVLTFFFLLIILGATDKRAPQGLRAHRHRPRPDADPPDRHPGHQPLGQPRPQHRPRALRRRGLSSPSSGCSGSPPAVPIVGRRNILVIWGDDIGTGTSATTTAA